MSIAAASMTSRVALSLPPQLAAVAAAQGGPFTTAQALTAGFDEREIYRLMKSGIWVRLRRGVYAEREGVLQAAPAPRFSKTPGGAPGSVPARGEHGADILRSIGLSPAEITRLLSPD